jgi:hypothetical protein
VAFFSAGWTSRHIVVSNRAKAGADVVKDSECSGVSGYVQLRLGFGWRKLRWDCLPGNQPGELLTCHLRKRIEVAHLRPDILIGAVKPEALSCASVNAQRSTNGIAVPAGLQVVLLGEDLDPFSLPALLEGNAEPLGQIADINPQVVGWQWFNSEDPKMAATTAVLKRRIYTVVSQLGTNPGKVRKRIRVIRIYGQPLRALTHRVNGIQRDGDFAFQVATDRVWSKAEALTGFPVLGTVIIMTATSSGRPVRLDSVGTTIYQQMEVGRH